MRETEPTDLIIEMCLFLSWRTSLWCCTSLPSTSAVAQLPDEASPCSTFMPAFSSCVKAIAGTGTGGVKRGTYGLLDDKYCGTGSEGADNRIVNAITRHSKRSPRIQ